MGGFVTGNRVSKISQQQEDQEDSLPGEVGEGERELLYDFCVNTDLCELFLHPD